MSLQLEPHLRKKAKNLSPPPQEAAGWIYVRRRWHGKNEGEGGFYPDAKERLPRLGTSREIEIGEIKR